MENEAVVAEVLRQAREWGEEFSFTVEEPALLAFNGLTGLHPTEGMRTWQPPDPPEGPPPLPQPSPPSSPVPSPLSSIDARAAPEQLIPMPASMVSLQPPAAGENWLTDDLSRCIRLMPHRDDCGGFFVAAIRRDGGAETLNGEESAAAGAATPEAMKPELEAKVEAETAAEAEVGARAKAAEEAEEDAEQLVELPASSDEWRAIADFYAIDKLEGRLLWSPSRAGERWA